jgi:hypothetical protein
MGITARVDGDDWFTPNALEVMAKFYENENVAATSGAFFRIADMNIWAPARMGKEFPRSWIWCNPMSWRQELYWKAKAKYPDAFYCDCDDGGCPASDVAVFAPIAKIALEEGRKVRACYEPIYGWRWYPGNEQSRRRSQQVACERAIFGYLHGAKAHRHTVVRPVVHGMSESGPPGVSVVRE